MNETRQLVKMANQIADNLEFHGDTASSLADHLRRFWAPSMRKSLREHALAGGADLKPVVKQVIIELEDA